MNLKLRDSSIRKATHKETIKAANNYPIITSQLQKNICSNAGKCQVFTSHLENMFYLNANDIEFTRTTIEFLNNSLPINLNQNDIYSQISFKEISRT